MYLWVINDQSTDRALTIANTQRDIHCRNGKEEDLTCADEERSGSHCLNLKHFQMKT